MTRQKQTLGPDYNEIEQAIADMLKENTGMHFLDSGGAYGRHWQRNQAIADFRQLPELSIEIWDDRDFCISLDVFHYLTSFLELDGLAKDLQKQFDDYSELPDNKDKGWYELMQTFAEDILRDQYGYRIEESFNTYNYENLLGQVLQGLTFHVADIDYPDYIILQIHGGCDVRGGYTKPRIFKVPEFDYFTIVQFDLYASCKCTNCSSDDSGYHWYIDGSTADKSHEYKFPSYWIKSGTKNPSNSLKCTRCKSKVYFTPCLVH
ncbi:hypothetical protein Ngar_c27880 [Candidatus Nitrososphaera gargensis Ga9.2]|uniref:Uncharacterized protein n=1 Tax=Nitrososphaera gargensis (strain Ga9.2) TaxID=1237085 RepID=K0INP0_NITGG|nr:hypothetical protein [Candidatus Nitrososphaera gargensis]AFU59709.1 hypothetical protein Ngar_c27880 [Candidatus Nitrososphaera gargensis Ga9.2]